MMATTTEQPTQFCSNCGIGPFFFVQARRYPTLCLDCSDDVSRATGGPQVDGGVHHGSLVELVGSDGRRTLGRFDGRQASGPCVVALRRSSLADNGYRRVRPGDRVELARVWPAP